MLTRLAAFLAVIGFAFGFQSLRAAEGKEWTFLFFMNANNNLEDAGYGDIREMERAGSDDRINIVVQLGALSSLKTRRILIQKNLKPYTKEEDQKTFHSSVIEEMPIQDMGSTNTMVDFLKWGIRNYPAKHYFVNIWNHGSGWSKESLPEKGISYDDISGNFMKTNEFADAIDQVSSVTGAHIDIIGFDACLMAMIEIGDSLAGLADYMVASEEDVPRDGYPYDDFLLQFSTREQLSPKNLLHDLVKTYGASYTGGSQGTNNVTISAVDLSKMELVKRRLSEWVGLANTKVTDSQSIPRKDYLSAAENSVSFDESDYRDLGSYVQEVLRRMAAPDFSSPKLGAGDSSDLMGRSRALLQSIQDVVVENFVSHMYSGAMGLAIYLPFGYNGYSSWSSFDAHRHDDYLKLKFVKTTDWSKHLDFLFPAEPSHGLFSGISHLNADDQ